MSFENPGDGKRCDHCNQPGKPYTHNGQQFSGLHAYQRERLCPSCLDIAATADLAAPGVQMPVNPARSAVPDGGRRRR